MATVAEPVDGLSRAEQTTELISQWRRLIRAATAVALVTSPVVFFWFHNNVGWGTWWSLLATFFCVIAFRGGMDIVLRHLIPWPSLFGTDSAELREEDVVNRRRGWYWTTKYKRWLFIYTPILIIFAVVYHYLGSDLWTLLLQALPLLVTFPIFFLFNFLIFMGPLMLMGISQIQAFEPGDADWGVELAHVRGQAEAKEEVRRVVSLWQSGEAFEQAGGKRERGLLMLGAPGTGKTMMSKAIATGFNSPFISIPGSGFAQAFMGIDAVIVRWLAWRAKKLARKWGGQCIVFIDEIDAVGMRRASLGSSHQPAGASMHDYCFYGPNGALTPTGDLVLETRAWRERLFQERAPEPRSPYPQFVQRVGGVVNQIFPGMGGMGGGGLALNQLLVVMDGIGNPPFMKKFFTNRLNTFLDATYIVPRHIGKRRLRLRPPRPRSEQIYFIGACNVPIEQLDPALTRPGRMGRHVWFRTPTKRDRLDIFDLYIKRVSHEEDLDEPRRRDELARITNGYAQPLDAQVLTPSGWKPMGEIEVGDQVIGGDGKPTTVVGVHPRGDMDVYRVTLNDGTSTRCTADHLWSVDALDPRMQRRTFTLRELIDRRLRWSPGGNRFYLPKLNGVEFRSDERLPVDPYLLGFLIGDGGLAGTTPGVCSAEAESVERVAELLPVGVSLVQHGPRNWWLSSGRRGGRPNPLTESLRTVGLWRTTSHTKFIPDAYKRSSLENRLALLQGLLDTDGSVDYRRGTGAEFYTASRRLADDVAGLTRSLGGVARVKVKREGWRVAIDLGDERTPFRLTRKASIYRRSRKPFRRRITAVEPAGQHEVRCITVANEDGLYVTDDYIVTHNSPAMIEQVCSMALTHAHHDGRERFSYTDIVEAMTTVESGTAINIDYVPEETRAVAIHEAGHAIASHAYMKGAESTRISIRRRGSSLGHHQALQKDERFSAWQSEEMANLVWGLGAMAAERVFYDENSTGVGGDVQTATALAAWMVGACAMGPETIDFGDTYSRPEYADEARERIEKKFQKIGNQILNRTSGGPMTQDPISSVLSDPEKKRAACILLGQAYIKAYALVQHNRAAVERVADVLVARKEIHGDEVLELLDSLNLQIPEVDLLEEKTWPKI